MVLAIDLLSERPEDVQEKRDLLEFASLRLDLMADISVRLSTCSDPMLPAHTLHVQPVHGRGALFLRLLLDKAKAQLEKKK